MGLATGLFLMAGLGMGSAQADPAAGWHGLVKGLPVWKRPALPPSEDWLIRSGSFKAGLYRGEGSNEIVLANGLVARTFRLTPNAATVGLDDLVSGQALLRAVKPEAVVELDGVRYEIGGLSGQPNQAFLQRDWLEGLRPTPGAFRLTGLEVLPMTERPGWKRVRHCAPELRWPPAGLHLRMDYRMPSESEDPLRGVARPSAEGRRALWRDDFARMDSVWRVHVSPADPRCTFAHAGKPGGICTPANTAVFAERELAPDTALVELTLDAGTDRSASWGPGLALAGRERTLKFYLRPGGSQLETAPQFGIWDGRTELLVSSQGYALDLTRPVMLRLRWSSEAVLCECRSAGGAWQVVRALDRNVIPPGPLRLRVGKTDRQGGAGDFQTPGELVRLNLLSVAAFSEYSPPARAEGAASRAVYASVHYELYDGIPCYAKWLTVSNGTGRPVRVDRFTSELLAVVERTAEVDELSAGNITPALHVETDQAFGGMMAQGANRRSCRWRADPAYETQVNYERKTPCLLEVGPEVGPAEAVPPGGVFESFRAWVMPLETEERERAGLAVRRLYRTVTPWVTENPLMMHVRYADWKTVTNAVAQCAAVGFEMVILTFGSGFDLEDTRPQTLEQARRLAEFGRRHGIEIGTYSLLASRQVGGGNDVVMPAGQRPVFGHSPCLGSAWGIGYFQRLRAFYEQSGFTLLEHDGSYPGDVCASTNHPGHRGLEDSRWAQWSTIAGFYRWCREQGIYLNVPDHYFFCGSSKTGMGYRESNWSLPREQQVLHTRQNIYDGTWQKTPSMGWMFVPLTEYHGGGAAATIEPLGEHLDHYERMLVSNLALGVQACYRGPRLYDTEATRAMVKRWVDWFKAHRDILESDLIHGRRADGRDVDWMLHVNPALREKGLLVVFNPLDEPVARTLRVNLYYTGLTNRVRVREGDGQARVMTLDRAYAIELPVRIPARGMQWYVME